MTFISKGFYVVCDGCYAEFDPPTSDTKTVAEQAEEVGWSIDLRLDDKDFCPACVAAEKPKQPAP